MKRMIPFEEVHVLDINSEYYGVENKTLMENAGKGVADVIKKNFDLNGKKILVIAGTGNNGGDGYVAARYLSEDCDVILGLIKPPKNIRTSLSRENFERLNIPIIVGLEEIEKEIKNCYVVVDAIFGIGIKGEIIFPYSDLMDIVNNSGKQIVSIDVPSGLGTNKQINPDITVTFHDVKYKMNSENCGKIDVIDIGIPEKAVKYTGPGEFIYYPKPRKDSHKGDNGLVLVIGGGPYTGAVMLSSLAAYRVGADLVHVATSEKIYDIVASYSPSFIVHKAFSDVLTPDSVDNLILLSKDVDTVLIGPGLGLNENTKQAVRDFVKRCDKPMTIDADGIKALSLENLKGKKIVITPHKTEFEILTKQEPTLENVTNIAKEYDITILLKGNIDTISDGEHTKLNDTGTPAMTVGGTGDVLAGVVAGLMSKGLTPYNAARLGAFITGYAGELTVKEKNCGLLPEDIIENIPNVLNQFL